MTPLKRYDSLKVCARILTDICCIVLAYLFATFVIRQANWSWSGDLYKHRAYLFTFVFVWCGAAMDQRLFASRRSESLVALLFSVAKAFFTTLLFSAFLMALFRDDGLYKTFFCAFGLGALSTLLVFRLALGLSLWNLRRHGWNARRILIIGANERTAHLVNVFLANEQYGYHVEGFLDDDEERARLLKGYGLAHLGPIKELEHILVNRVIDAVYISLPVRSYYETVQNVAHLCEGVGVPVRLLADLFPLRMSTSDVANLANIPLLSLGAEPELQTRFTLRRAVDMVASCILLVLLAPILIVIALIIKLDSKGPILARQPVSTADGRQFNTITFRVTIDSNAEEMEAKETVTRLTRVGRYLRRYGLDELPQLVNVLLGQIDLSGTAYHVGSHTKMDHPV